MWHQRHLYWCYKRFWFQINALSLILTQFFLNYLNCSRISFTLNVMSSFVPDNIDQISVCVCVCLKLPLRLCLLIWPQWTKDLVCVWERERERKTINRKCVSLCPWCCEPQAAGHLSRGQLPKAVTCHVSNQWLFDWLIKTHCFFCPKSVWMIYSDL